MAEHIKLQSAMSSEDVLKIEIIVNQALIDILLDKQVISEEELIAGVRKIKRSQQKQDNTPKKIVAI